MSEANNVWRVTVDGAEHEVELDHGTVSGNREITLDGEVIVQDQKFFDTGTTHDFTIAGHPARIEITMTHTGFAHQSSLHVDDRYVEPLTR